MRGIWGTMLALALFGAAGGQTFSPEQRTPRIPAAEVGDYSTIRSMAIVSELGAQLRVEGRNGTKVVDVSGWKVDERVVATVRKYAGERFEIVPTGADATLTVRPIADPTPGPAGVGVHADAPLAFCANFEIVVTTRGSRVLGKAVSRMQMHATMPASPACFAEDASLRSELTRGPGAATLESLDAQLKVLLPRALVETLRALKLGVDLPAPGDHSIAPPENPLDRKSITRVAVVSALGDTFSFSQARDVVHDRELSETPIPGWRLDASVEHIATAALSRAFTVTPGSFDRGALSRIVLQEGRHPTIAGLTPSADVDAYVLLVRAYRAGTGSSGPGLWRKQWMDGATFAYANYAVIVVDGRTLKVMKAALPAMPPAAPTAYPLVRVDGSLWPEGAKDGAAAERARPVIEQLIADSVPETLYQLGLSDD